MAVNVVYTPEAIKYMDSKGCHDVLVSLVQPRGCCGSMPEVSIKLIDKSKADELRAKNAACLEGEMGAVFVGRNRIPEDGSTVTVDLHKGFLGMSSLVVEGLLKADLA